MVGVLLATVLAIALSVLFILRMRSRRDPGIEDVRWVEDFTMSSYRPMERLLAEADWEFLSRRCDEHLRRRLRAERRRLMRRYLKRLCADYSRVQRVARLKVANSPDEGSEFPAFLFAQNLIFSVGVAWLRTALALDAVSGRVVLDVRPLLDSVGVLLDRTRGMRQAA